MTNLVRIEAERPPGVVKPSAYGSKRGAICDKTLEGSGRPREWASFADKLP